MKIQLRLVLPALLVLLLPLSTRAEETKPANVDADAQRGRELFDSTILPALQTHCFDCHSKANEVTEGGLELDSPAGLFRGGDSGPMLKAHATSDSRLLDILRHAEGVSAMPPEEKLSDELIAAFEEWIRLGAPDTRTDSGPTAKEERLAEAQKHWAFNAPVATDAPEVQQTDWVRDAMIDTAVLAQMEAANLQPVEDANRTTLIRRLYFDLIGTPPAPADIDAFVADESADAVERLVDRLLASPQFGERWGRHWLDVVRYAESSGMEFNFTYPHAWPYRNYVIDSFNADKPFHTFLKEQIAGDLLPATEGETAAVTEARKIAPSILAFGPKQHNSGGETYRLNITDDQIDVVFKSTQALTVSCARCHDHKFDPIPTKDYYAVAGIFMSTEPLYGTIKQKYSNNPTDLLPIGDDALARHEAADAHDKKIAEAEKPLAGKKEELKKAEEAVKVAKTAHEGKEQLLAAITSRQDATTDGSQSDADKTQERSSAQAEVDETAAALTKATELAASLKAEVTTIEKQVKDLKASHPGRPHYAMTVRDREKPADIKLAIRGNAGDRGDVVPRGFLSAVHVPEAAPVDGAQSGRLQLADWIANPNNPLTARVMVNRIWQHLLGRGIVPTVNNFGLIGKTPTHPELLDNLALQFIADGWSVKTMIRRIVLSRTYQLSSQITEHNAEIDPDARLLWRANPRRLEAEAIRDAILTVSGKLDGGRPEVSTVKGLGDQLVRGIAPDKIQPASNHRSVYLPVVRDYVPEIFDLFDFPSPSLVSGQRPTTNVPSQALFLRNSPFVAEQSRHAAERLLADESLTDDAARVTQATRLALGRTPTAEEQAAAVQLIEQVRQTSIATKEATTDDDAKNAIHPEADALSAWFLTLFTTAEFRYLVDITPATGAQL